LNKLAALLLSLLIVAPVHAAEEKKGEAPKSQTIALEAVALPVIVNGRLLNYVFVSIRLDLGPKADGAAVRAKEQYLRDDLVRTGHRAAFTRLDDYTRVDEGKVKAELMRFAPTVVGPGVIQSITITKQVSQKLQTLPPVQQSRQAEIIP
jgi:flagellar basal body-associated protein FliL